MKTKVLVVANDESTILNFRQEIIKAFIDNGFEVIVCFPFAENMQTIRNLGCNVIDLPVSRHGKNIFEDVGLLINCYKIIKKFKPSVVLTYTVKPNIYASFACQMLKIPYINNITGLGSVLQREGILTKIILQLQKIAYRKSSCVFFQNNENYQRLLNSKVINQRTPVTVLPGSGVNLELMKYEPFPVDEIVVRFIIVSRIREDKGYKEFFDMAENIKSRYPNTEFHVVGWYEEDALKLRLENLVDKNIINYHGKVSQIEVHRLVKECNCLVHPSYHEGMSNVVMEAAATGRPVIASDIAGCRELIDDGVTGYTFKSKSSQELIASVEKFIKLDHEAQMEMGKRGRLKMEKEFDRQTVAHEYISKIEKLEE